MPKLHNEIEALVRRSRDGDERAFEKLVNEHMQLFFKVCWSLTGDVDLIAEAIQESIITIWLKLPQLNKAAAFRAWAARILVNKCRDLARRAENVVTVDVVPERDDCQSASEDLEWQDVLNAVDPRYRTVMQLYYGEGFKTREISTILDMNKSTVTTYLQRGREQAKEYFESVKRS